MSKCTEMIRECRKELSNRLRAVLSRMAARRRAAWEKHVEEDAIRWFRFADECQREHRERREIERRAWLRYKAERGEEEE